MDELFKDRLARYSFLFAKRNTVKEKDRFLKALITDIQQERNDIQVIEFNKTKKSSAHNVYVGNVRTASHIIGTYFDTPLSYSSDYVYFDREDQRKKTLRSIVTATLLWLVAGLVFTLVYIQVTHVTLDFHSLATWILMLFSIVYFTFFAKITKGNWNRKTLVRNTSSIVSLLQMISNPDKNIAYVFLDEGCYGDGGLQELKKKTKRNAEIYLLDSIGGHGELIVQGKAFSKLKSNQEKVHTLKQRDDINYIYAFDKQVNGKYALSQSAIRSKELNYENFKIVQNVLKSCIKGE